MFHIVESCPLTKLNGDLSRLHSADKDAVSWLTSWFMSRIREEEVPVNGCLIVNRFRFRVRLNPASETRQ